jgi:ATP-dependent helicase/nuclease subunit A
MSPARTTRRPGEQRVEEAQLNLFALAEPRPPEPELSAEAGPALPRELVLASAGSGKTFRISSGIIGLLAAGAEPEEVFASTFTRKAAGEILGRVLERLSKAALHPAEARELSEQALLPGSGPARDTAGWLAVLQRLLRALHRLNIGTLDSFFVRVAGAFAAEAGLPQGWRIVEDAEFERIRADALDGLLRSADREELLALLRGLNRGEARRPVHGALAAQADELLRIHHQLDPDADPWGALQRALGELEPVSPAEHRELATRFRALPPPDGNGGWRDSLDGAADALEQADWLAFLDNALCRKLLGGEDSYYRRPIEGEVELLLHDGFRLARRELGSRLIAHAAALGSLARHLAHAFDERQRETGGYRFEDLTRLLGRRELWDRADLHYRLDSRLRHILLDEFQDTSLTQWRVLEPLLQELLSGHLGERAALVVADPKQSIYGWRGGEPQLVRHVAELPAIRAAEPLATSWRSSQAVLDVVNQVFGRIAGNPILPAEESATAREWASSFAEHRAARDLPGHVRLQVGPRGDGRSSVRPELFRCAAELVRDLQQQAPGFSTGVLTRTNAAVARMIFELKRLDLEASEEGGNPLTDSPAVGAVLALLRLADHPGDSVLRYHVARTPVGEVEGFTEYRDEPAACRLAHSLRRRLLDDGYGRTLERLAARLERFCDARDWRRLQQLVERGYRYDAQPTLRPTDFARAVAAERVEDPLAASVRVMTVHQAKGLEFDIVVLPHLDVELRKAGDNTPLTYQPDPTARITAAFPPLNQRLRQLFSDVDELQAAQELRRAAELRDGLSALYVALTRARHGLHLLIAADGATGPGSRRTFARIVREALVPGVPAIEADVLYEHGNAEWYRKPEAPTAPAAKRPHAGPLEVRLAPHAERTRMLPRRSPSSLEGDARVDLRLLLDLDTATAMRQGSIAHAWFEAIEWLEGGSPAEESLRERAREAAVETSSEEIDALLARFRRWLQAPAIQRALSRARYPAGASVQREVPFVQRTGEALLEGVIDRLVLVRENGRVVRAEVLDFKTDQLDGADPAALHKRVEYYRPQLQAYRDAVVTLYDLEPPAVSAAVLMLEAGRVVEIG